MVQLNNGKVKCDTCGSIGINDATFNTCLMCGQDFCAHCTTFLQDKPICRECKSNLIASEEAMKG